MPPPTRGTTEQPVRVYLRARATSAAPSASAGPSGASDDIEMKSSHVVMRGKTFHFDACFAGDATQNDVYTIVGPRLLEAASSGLNASVLAYGQSGSGKTHTMFGDASAGVRGGMQAGVVPRLLDDIFALSRVAQGSSSDTDGAAESSAAAADEAGESASGVTTYTISARMFEVYNERAYDMLASTVTTSSAAAVSRRPQAQVAARVAGTVPTELRIRDNSVIEGIVETTVTNSEAALALLERGMGRRRSAATNKNDRSSRSHAVFQLRVRKETITAMPTSAGADDDTPTTRTVTMTSLLSLVDLAGSEKYIDAATGGGSEGDRIREMTQINLSLSTLRRVIQALADAGAGVAQAQLPPYRDSLLTRALMATFGGNSATTVIVTVSPLPEHASDTFASLQFGSVARRVVNKTTANVDTKDRLISAMSDEIGTLRALLAAREAELASRAVLAATALAFVPAVPNAAPVAAAEKTDAHAQTEEDVDAAARDAAGLVAELEQQLHRLEAMRTEAESEREEHDATRRQLMADIAVKDRKIGDLHRVAIDERRGRHRAIAKYLDSRPDLTTAIARIAALVPADGSIRCGSCAERLVEESEVGKALAHALAELAEREMALQEAQEDAVRHQAQVNALARDLVTMQRKLELSASLQRRCDEQQVLLDMREKQIAKYLEDITVLQMESLRASNRS